MLTSMSKSKESHQDKDHHGSNHHAAGHNGAKTKALIHHDWRFWIAIVLMLLAIGVYVMTFDEALQPGGVDEPGVPMVAE